MAQSTCQQCNRTFAGLVYFDDHQEELNDKRGTVICVDMDKIGYVERDGGIWGPPIEALREGISFSHRPKDVLRLCDCGKTFERPIRRGRPPTKCPDCREK